MKTTFGKYKYNLTKYPNIHMADLYLNCKVKHFGLYPSRNTHNQCQEDFHFIHLCLCLVGFGVEGAALSRESIHSNKSQSITTTAATNTGQLSHTTLLLSAQVNKYTLTQMHTHIEREK